MIQEFYAARTFYTETKIHLQYYAYQGLKVTSFSKVC